MNNAPHLALGICIVAIGVALTLERLHVLEAERILRLWPVGLILLGASVMAQAFWPGADTAADGRRRSSVAPLLLLSIILFGFLIGPTLERRSFARSGSQTSETVTMFAVMGADKRISSATRFRGGEMTSFMGGNQLDLRQATIAPGEEAVIDVFAMMGGIELRVPDDWIVDVRAVPVMGGVEDQRRRAGRRRVDAEHQPAEAGDSDEKPPETKATNADTTAAPRLVLRGFIMMGGLVIKP